MVSGKRAELPDVTDEDIRRASRLLGLGEQAFFGPGENDRRLEALKRMDSFDVAACPGSGKTTLLVAKLAILAEKWPHRTRGICVLSHTNAARHEIESRLGGTPAGRALLSYPHFVGTIHGFTNEFLALPWIRSKGWHVQAIDDDRALDLRWRALSFSDRSALTHRHGSKQLLRVKRPDWDLGEISRLGRHTPTYTNMIRACRRVTEEGYFCYAEMFVWANELLDKHFDVIRALRARFPIVLVDEAQDTDHVQASLLHRAFTAGDSRGIVQRVGDDNQAIYGFYGDTGPVSDTFPNKEGVIDLPSSCRFGPEIAALAQPFGVRMQHLVGIGPAHLEEPVRCEPKHTIFLFDAATAGKVLDEYGALLIRTFPAGVLRRGHFAAVGAVHKEDESGELKKDSQFPKRVGDYWSGYDPDIGGAEPRPNSFVQFLNVARGRAQRLDHTSSAVETIAEGLLRLVEIIGGSRIARTRRRHAQMLELLERAGSGLPDYQELLRTFAVGRTSIEAAAWRNVWTPRLLKLAEVIAGACPSRSEAEMFLSWRDTPQIVAQPNSSSRRDNVYVYSDAGAEVAVRVGSIHSVKGQTHTATLVLETFNHAHHLEMLRDWLLGKSVGRKRGSKEAELKRLRTHYVAMTRPTHLLCLAMKRSSFEKKPGFDASKQKLEARGWQVQDLTQDQPNAPLG